LPGIRWARLAGKVAIIAGTGKNVAITVRLADSS
jgi:hypothetical protein